MAFSRCGCACEKSGCTTGEKFLLIKCCPQGCYLVERLVADIALVSLLSAVGQPVVLVVALLVESLPTKLAREWLVAVVNSHVSVQCGTPEQKGWLNNKRLPKVTC